MAYLGLSSSILQRMESYLIAAIFKELPVRKREIFWSGIWDVANSPDELADYGITAIYGSVTYTQIRDGLIYIFRITPTGQLYPEVIPEF